MTSTNTIEFLLSDAAKAGRLTRLAGYQRIDYPTPTHVVHVETHHGMIELDANGIAHADDLILTWIKTLNNKSARHHFVAADGSLINSSPIYDFQSFLED